MRLLLFFLAIFFVFCGRSPNPTVVLETDLGNITIELYTRQAPLTANNFLAYIDSGKYDGLAMFYRTVKIDNQPSNNIKIEVIQAGFLHDSLIEKYQFDPIIHESTQKTGIKHLDGTVSMARVEPGTASSEFFICIGSQPELDWGGKRNPDGQGFAAFGRVVEGMDVVAKIHQLPDTSQYLQSPVIIRKTARLVR